MRWLVLDWIESILFFIPNLILGARWKIIVINEFLGTERFRSSSGLWLPSLRRESEEFMVKAGLDRSQFYLVSFRFSIRD